MCIRDRVNPLGNSGDQEYLISIGPKTVSSPYPTAYPEYLGVESQLPELNNLFSTLA